MKKRMDKEIEEEIQKINKAITDILKLVQSQSNLFNLMALNHNLLSERIRLCEAQQDVFKKGFGVIKN